MTSWLGGGAPAGGETAALEVAGLGKTFGKSRQVVAVSDVSFRVEPGEIVGLLGPNGAGKTTIIKCALGLVLPSAGHALVFGHDARHQSARVLAAAAAVLEGSRNIYWRLTPWENAEFFAALHGVPVNRPEHRTYLESLIERFGLGPVRNTQVRELSTGFKQKAAVVAALARRTPLVFLDEPTLGLDVETSLDLRQLLREMVVEEGRTVVLSSHDMDVVQAVCRRVVIISAGKVVADQDIASLLGLFRSRRYRLVLDGVLGGATREAIKQLDPHAVLEPTRTGSELRLQLRRASDLYDLIEVVRGGGLIVDTIVQSEPDLEHAFLGLVRKERDQK